MVAQPAVEGGQDGQGGVTEVGIAGGPVNPLHRIGNNRRLNGGAVVGRGHPHDVAGEKVGLLVHLPEDDVGDKPVGLRPAQQRGYFGLGLLFIQVGQGNGVEAGIPKPLERVTGEGGHYKAELLAVPVGHPAAQVGQQNLFSSFFQFSTFH